jgi:hypothetical protein
MSKTLVIGTVLAALGAGIVSSPAFARVDSGDRAAQCREQAYAMWQHGRNGDGLDRQREFIVNSCMANGAPR